MRTRSSILAGSDELWRINADHVAEKASEDPITSGDNVTAPVQSVTLQVLADQDDQGENPELVTQPGLLEEGLAVDGQGLQRML